MNKLIFMLSCLAFTLVSCGKFHGTDVSVWAEGKWLVFWLPFVGSILTWRKVYISYKSGTEKGDMNPKSPTFGKYFDTEGRMAAKGWLVFSIVLTCAWIAAIILVNAEK